MRQVLFLTNTMLSVIPVTFFVLLFFFLRGKLKGPWSAISNFEKKLGVGDSIESTSS